MTFVGTSSTPFSEKNFFKWMQSLKETQESIQSLSAWCVQHRTHYKEIVNQWFKYIKKVKIGQRLRLFYLANDIIQVSKRKHINGFVDYWANILPEVVPLVSKDEKIRKGIKRIFTVWNERTIYSEELLAKLNALLNDCDQAPSCEAELVGEFDAAKLRQYVDQCDKCHKDCESKLDRVKSAEMTSDHLEEFKKSLKERRQGDHYVQEFEDGIHYIEAYVEALNREVLARHKLVNLLETCASFYLEQKGEAKYVANAYKNYSQKVKAVKKRLDEMTSALPDVSPVPSPDVNAPSPTPEDDFDLPDDDVSQETTVSNEPAQEPPASYMGTSTDISNLLKSISYLETQNVTSSFDTPEKQDTKSDNQLGRPIEVLDTQSSGLKGISDFFKNMGASLNLPSTFSSLMSTSGSSEATPTANSSGKGSDTSTPPPSLPWPFMSEKGDRKTNEVVPSPKWNSTLLPSKIPTWSQDLGRSSDSENSWSNDKCEVVTPQSPPEYQPTSKEVPAKSSEWLPVFSSSPIKDIDHRDAVTSSPVGSIPNSATEDVDQRVNLWTSVDIDQRVGQNGLPQTHYGDIDHRLVANSGPPPPPPPVEQLENNSVDMDIGVDEDDAMPLPPPPPIPASLIDITKPPPNVWQSVIPPPPFASLLTPPPPPESAVLPISHTRLPPPPPPSNLGSVDGQKRSKGEKTSPPDVLDSIPMPSQSSIEKSSKYESSEVMCIGSVKSSTDRNIKHTFDSSSSYTDKRSKCPSPEVQFIKNELKRPYRDPVSDRKLTDLKDKWRSDGRIDWSNSKRRKRDFNDRHTSSGSHNPGKNYDSDYYNNKNHRRRSSKH